MSFGAIWLIWVVVIATAARVAYVRSEWLRGKLQEDGAIVLALGVMFWPIAAPVFLAAALLVVGVYGWLALTEAIASIGRPRRDKYFTQALRDVEELLGEWRDR